MPDQNQNIQEELIFDDYENKLLGLINSAKNEILVCTYILEQDKFGTKILNALSARANEGVKVKMILDGYGSWPWIKDHLFEFRAKNFEIRLFNPLPWPFSSHRFSLIFRVDLFFKLLVHWNQRCHQKFFVFDGEVAIVGSRNLCDAAVEWRETNIIVRGEPVAEIRSVFDQFWILGRNKLLQLLKSRKYYKRLETTKYIFTNYIHSLRKKSQRMLLDRIFQAEFHIRITTPYFFPTYHVYKKLLRKASSGVEVSILLPKKSDVYISKWIGLLHYERLLKNGARIYEYKPGILHAKSMILDDRAIVGSSNFNHRSFQRDFELNYSIVNPDVVAELNSQFIKDIQNSTQITSIPQMTLVQKTIASLVMKLAPSWF